VVFIDSINTYYKDKLFLARFRLCETNLLLEICTASYKSDKPAVSFLAIIRDTPRLLNANEVNWRTLNFGPSLSFNNAIACVQMASACA